MASFQIPSSSKLFLPTLKLVLVHARIMHLFVKKKKKAGERKRETFLARYIISETTKPDYYLTLNWKT